MAGALGISVAEFLSTYAHRNYGFLSLSEVRNEAGGWDCVFLKALPGGKRGCALYEHRPMQCRTWPFWPSNLRSQADWEEAAEHCPGMRAGGLPREGVQGAFVPVEDIRVTARRNDFRL